MIIEFAFGGEDMILNICDAMRMMIKMNVWGILFDVFASQ